MNRKEYFLLAILLSQILVESLFLFLPTIEGQRFIYFTMVKALKIGLMPSFFIWHFSENIYTKVLSLTLIFFNLFLILVEILAQLSGCEWMVTTINKYDYYNFTLIIVSILVSLGLNGLLNSNSKLFIYILLLLRKVKRPKM